MYVRDNRYAYTSRRVDGRVRTVYIGLVGSAAVDEHIERERSKAEALQAVEGDSTFKATLRALARQAMTERGYTRTNCRHWRQSKHEGTTTDN